MKSLPALAFAGCLLPAGLAAQAAADTDVYRELVRYRATQFGASQSLNYTTRQFLEEFLETPDSPYSSLVDTPTTTNELWWPSFVDGLRLRGPDTFGTALAEIQWQAGLTKARPGIDIEISDEVAAAYRGMNAAASARKAGIDADIFWKARDMNGPVTVAAGYAVALQMLRNQIDTLEAEVRALHGAQAMPTTTDYARLGIKKDVFNRYMAMINPDSADPADQRYLSDLLRYALNRRAVTVERGVRQLPPAFRVARVAAAYTDANGYFNPRGYCSNNEARPDEPSHGSDFDFQRPLCFIDATDRGVQAWYRRQLRLDASGLRIHENHHPEFSHLVHWVTTVLMLIDFAAFVEVTESIIADDLAGDGAIGEADAEFAAERSQKLNCRMIR